MSRPILYCLVLAGAFSRCASAQPVVTMVLNRTSYSAAVSPGGWVMILGYNLATGPLSAQAGSLADTLGGTSVTVAGTPAQLLSVSENEIDALISPQVAIPRNTVVPLVVTSGAGRGTYNIRLTRNAPAIMTRSDGSGRALLYDTNSHAVETLSPEDTVIIYATGLGPTDDSGRAVDDVEVYIGDQKAQVLSAGLVSDSPGVYQVKAIAPAPATDRLYLRTGGWQSNIASIPIRGGMNTANVTGAIDGLNPSSDPVYPKTPQRPCLGDYDRGPCGPIGMSESMPVILHAGTFAVSFDIVAGAGPFTVAAVGEAGGSIVTIDPASGTYTATVTLPTQAARVGNFSLSIVPLWDYLSCNWISAVCLPFPASQVPQSRSTPWLLRALQMLPAPDTAPPGSPNGFLQASGNLNGSRFSIDGQNNGTLASFGGFVQVPYGPFERGVSRFSLYVDRRLIASKELPYVLYQRAPAAYGPDDF